VESEKELIAKIKSGDSLAFEKLITPYQQKVYNIAVGILCNYEDADDAAQETFIKVFKYINNFSGKSLFYTWLYRITYNVCLDILRKRNKSHFGFITKYFQNDEGDDMELQLEDTAPLPDEICMTFETQDEVRRAISKLKEHYRTAIVLRDIEGLPYEEISKILDISEGTVKSRINRARAQLKDILVKDFPELFKNYSV